MKKIVYLAPALLLGLVGKGAMADQTTHVSRLDAGFMTSLNESQQDQAANANKPEQEQVVQSKDVKTNKVKKTITTHISSLDSGIIEDNAKTNETKYAVGTNTNSLDNNSVENNTKAVQYNTFSVKTNIKTVTNFTESKVTDGDSDQHTIEDPSNDQITIHYVDENGKSIAGLKDYTININNAPKGNSTGQFKVPDKRYVLPDPTGDYQLQHDKHDVHHNAVTHVVHHPKKTHVVHHPEETHVVHHEATGHNVATGTQWVVTGSDGDTGTFDDDMNNHTPGDSMWGTGSGNPGDTVVSATPSTTYTWVEDSPAWDETVVDRDAWDETVTDRKAWNETVVDRPAYNETVGNNVFSDNSKNIKSIIGNTVNVILKHGTKNVDIDNSDMEFDSWRKVHVINSDNQNNLTNKSVKFKVGYTLDLVSLAKTANFNSSRALSDPNDFIGENKLTDPVGFSAINTKLLSISL